MIEAVISTSRYKVKALLTFTLYRKFRMHAAFRGQPMTKSQFTGRDRHFLSQHIIKPLTGTRPLDSAFCKSRHIQQANIFSNIFAFIPDMFKVIRPAERPMIFLSNTFRRKPIWAFPAKQLTKDSPFVFHAVITRRGS